MSEESGNFVSLKSRYGEGIFIADTLGNAVRALDELGLCMNYAVLTQLSERTGMLVYQGWVYRSTRERLVELPFSEKILGFENQFTQLLTNIFAPFAINSMYTRSFVEVVSLPTENGGFFVSLMLNFETEGQYEEIYSALDEVDNSKDPVSSTFFCLD